MILHEGGLEFHATEGEPRIHDLDLAEQLGYQRPRDIRPLIRDAIEKVSGFGVCGVAPRTSGSAGGRPTDEFWLTERQAMFIVTKSGTVKAAEMTMLLVDAFLAVRKQIARDEQALKTIPRRLVEALLLPKPCAEWERMFQPSLVKAICALHGIPWAGGAHPRFLSSTNRKIYDLVFSSGIGSEIKRRNPLPKWGSNHHQQLTPEARDYLSAQLKIVEAIARQSTNKEDFWRRMDREYAAAMLQLPIGGVGA
jgi:hypothetical protein